MVLVHFLFSALWFSVFDIKHRLLPKRHIYFALITLLPFVAFENLDIAAANTGLYLAIYIFSRGALGFGDVRLSTLIGMYFGYCQLKLSELFELNFLTWITASVYIAVMKKFKSSMLATSIPFAPFLFIGPAVALLK